MLTKQAADEIKSHIIEALHLAEVAYYGDDNRPKLEKMLMETISKANTMIGYVKDEKGWD